MIVPDGEQIFIYKNNSDGKGNSYGCHENYLVDRAVPFPNLVKHLIPFFVSRQIYTGAGKVGGENGSADVDYQISQRADFFEVEVGLETTFKRPIINTRDEPHADAERYRRLHVIVGDANMSRSRRSLKVGTTAIDPAHDRRRLHRRGLHSGRAGQVDADRVARRLVHGRRSSWPTGGR